MFELSLQCLHEPDLWKNVPTPIGLGVTMIEEFYAGHRWTITMQTAVLTADIGVDDPVS
jgi:hypothetical protein